MARGFFNLPVTEVPAGGRRQAAVASLACGVTCKLSRGCPRPKEGVLGLGGDGLFILAEKPPAVFKAGKGGCTAFPGETRGLLSGAGLDPDTSCYTAFTVRCRPPDNKEPSAKEARTCASFWRTEIRERKPRAVLLLGKTALEAWMSDKWKKDLGGVSRWRGYVFPDREYGCWVIATHDPDILLKAKYDDDPFLRQFKEDIQLFIGAGSRPPPVFEDERKLVDVILEPRQAIERMRQLDSSRIAFDYETTGIKPHAAGHDIISCAISGNTDNAFAFPMGDKRVRRQLKTILTDPSIRKVAANIAFEEEWTRTILGCGVEGWEWDTMLTAHVIDNRPQFSGLKFQSAIHFGLFDYDSDITPFLTSGDDEGGNTLNRIRQAPIEKLLLYNGMDAILEHRLFKIQRRTL